MTLVFRHVEWSCSDSQGCKRSMTSCTSPAKENTLYTYATLSVCKGPNERRRLQVLQAPNGNKTFAGAKPSANCHVLAMLSWGPVAGQRLGAACNWGIASRSSTSLAGGLWFCRTWCLWMKMKRTPYLFWKFKLAQHPLTFGNLWIIPKRCPVNSYGVEMIWASFREASLEQTSGQSLALHVPQWFGAGNLEPEAQEAVVRGLIWGGGERKRLSPPHPISSSLEELESTRHDWHILTSTRDVWQWSVHAACCAFDAWCYVIQTEYCV